MSPVKLLVRTPTLAPAGAILAKFGVKLGVVSGKRSSSGMELMLLLLTLALLMLLLLLEFCTFG